MNSITVPANIQEESVTFKQLAAVRAISNSQRIDPDEECKRLYGCTPERLTKRSASRFIDHLRSLPRRSWSEVA